MTDPPLGRGALFLSLVHCIRANDIRLLTFRVLVGMARHNDQMKLATSWGILANASELKVTKSVGVSTGAWLDVSEL